MVKLTGLLDAVCPPGFEVLCAPLAVRHGEYIELQPDVPVGRFEDFTEQDLPKPPVLVVKVLSPSTVLNDLNTKKAAYERLGAGEIDRVRTAWRDLCRDRVGHGQRGVRRDGAVPVRIVPVDLLGRFA